MCAELSRVVVVGASLAGLQAAQTIHRSGFSGSITIVGEETHYPYDRPPLSKQFLAGSWEESKLRLRAAQDPQESGFSWLLDTRAVSLDLKNRQVLVRANNRDDTKTVDFDGLVIATGARARRLDGCDLDGVHVLRNLDDARELKADLEVSPDGQDSESAWVAKKVCIIGAGFIGAEVASTARGLGHDVTLVEAAPVPLGRVLDTGAGMAIAELHRANGVDVRLGVGVLELVGSGEGSQPGRVKQVKLADGSVIEVDVVVVGIGVIPNTEWLQDSGLEIDNGVVADQTCLAAPGVVVAGDVARWPNQRFGGQLMRVEQWDNAVEQGGYVGRRLLAWAAGGDVEAAIEPYAPTPWFWSDQYDRKIQLAGVPSSNTEIVHGSIEERCFVQAYSDDDGAFVGALAWSRPRHAMKARQLLNKGGTMAEARETLA